MKQDKDHIKDIFSSKLKGFEADLPPLLWDKIQADLPVEVSIRKPIRKSINKTIVWATAVAAIVIAVLFVMPHDEDVNKYIAKSVDSKVSRDRSSIAQWIVENKTVKTASNVKQSDVKSQSAFRALHSSSTVANTTEKDIVRNDNQLSANKTLVDDVVGQVNNNNEERVYVAEIDNTDDFQSVDPNFEQELKDKIKAFEAIGQQTQSLLAENNVGQKSIKGEKGFEIGVEGGGGLSKANDVANTARYASVSNGGLTTLRSQKFKLEHNQPISFGVAVSKKITDNISIESGIVYTYVSAKIQLEGKPEYNQDDQQYFHYLGIPLSVNYRFAQWKKADFYVSLGGLIQKDFYGKINSKSSIDDLLNSERVSSRDISQSKPQFSATGLLGVSYPLYNKLSVYSSFGGAHYFNANNEYETIFSDRKWLFNINLGLKFGF